MDEQTARIVVWGILAIALGVWIAAVRYVAETRRIVGRAQPPDRMLIEPAEPTAGIIGQVTIDAPPAGLAGRLARTLAQPQLGALGAIKIVEADETRVAFEQVLPIARTLFQDGEVRFSSAGAGRTLADYRLTTGGNRGLLLGAQLLLFVGLAAITGCWALMEYLVIPNPNASARWQVFQSLQVVHFIWPPFLLAGLCRMQRKNVVAAMETTLANLPHQAA